MERELNDKSLIRSSSEMLLSSTVVFELRKEKRYMAGTALVGYLMADMWT